MTDQKDTGMIRELSLEILIEVLEKGSYCNKTINAVLANYQYMDKKDRAFLTRLCEGTIEHVIELDYIINQFSSVKVKKMKPVIRNLLRMTVYQIKYMTQVPDRAACNEAVNLAKKKGFHGLSGFVNGLTRNISRKLDEVKYPNEENSPVAYLSVVYSMPEWIIEKWLETYDYETVKGILTASFEDRPTSIRCNTNLVSVDELKKELEAEHIHVEDGTYVDSALKMTDYNYMNGIEAFQKGHFQVQDESSMLVAKIADIKKNDKIIDVCAAPGGKSLHVAQLLEGSGHVEARDMTPDKVNLINENIARLGFENVTSRVCDATVLDQDSVGAADVVIADLPCSGLGVFGKKQDIKYNVTKEGQKELIALQRKILSVVSIYVKEGGTLIYSTCTINKEENEENVAWITENLPFQTESVDAFIPESLHSETTKKGYLQLLPGKHETDGFFIARLVKR